MALHLLEWSNLATIISAPTAVFALLFAGLQLRRTLAVERGRFTLEIERMLASHDRTHLRLRPGGDWFGTGRGPATIEEWGPVEDYMGLFEHCEILIQSGLLNPTMFKRLFGYRIENILANPVIVRKKLVEEKGGWIDFLMLVKRLHLVVPDLVREGGDS
jgi:hypothetical protein